jgi:hypothetical protein
LRQRPVNRRNYNAGPASSLSRPHSMSLQNWVRMTTESAPGCSVRSTAVLPAHAVVTSAAGLAFSDGGGSL